MSTQANKPIYIIDHVRSNSQMFNKMFAAHPQLEQVFMPLIAASLYGPEAVWHDRRHTAATDQSWRDISEKSGVAQTDTYNAAIQRLEGAVADFQAKGKIPWIKDHDYCLIPRHLHDTCLVGEPIPETLKRNPTVFSTAFLDSVTPVFLIRHPALSIPSFFRKLSVLCGNEAEDEDFRIYTSMRWARMIFDSYRLRSGEVPVVVDAADVVYNTKPVIKTLCPRLGIEDGGVQYAWEPKPVDEQPADPLMRGFFKEMYDSAGVERRANRPSEENMDIDEKEMEWTEGFGEETAKTFRKLVEAGMPDFEYLKGSKLQA